MSEVFNPSSGLIELAPDLTFPADLDINSGYRTTGIVDTTAELTEMLGLSGKFHVSMLQISRGTNGENIDVHLTVDGTVVWNTTATFSSTANLYLLCDRDAGSGNPMNSDPGFICRESLSLKVKAAVDPSVELRYRVRPIK